MVAVVVPVGVVLLAALVAAAVLTRRRRARAAGYGKGPPPLSDSSSSAAARPPAGEAPSSSAARSSDIFMGLDEGSMPPVWTQQYEEEVGRDEGRGWCDSGGSWRSGGLGARTQLA